MLLIWSLLARTRRLPGTLLVLALLGAAATGALAVSQSQAVNLPLDQAVGGTAQYTFVGNSSASVDLTGLAADTPATVTIHATASVVNVQLAHQPASIVTNSDTIDVMVPSRGGPSTASQLTIIIEGDLSIVELDVTP